MRSEAAQEAPCLSTIKRSTEKWVGPPTTDGNCDAVAGASKAKTFGDYLSGVHGACL